MRWTARSSRPATRSCAASRRSAAPSGSDTLLGIGIAVYVEITNGISEGEFGAVEITEDGGAIVRTGSFSHGQGHETTFAQIVSERTGIDLDKIQVLAGDTDRVPRGTGTYGSKSTQIGGAAAGQASEILVERAKEFAADALEANPEDMVLDLDTGSFHVTGSAQPALGWAELAERLAEDGRLAELSAETDFKPDQPTFPFGAHVAVVEVDAETGSVRLKRLIACDDAGRIINPLVADGQVHGGLAAGIAQALYEEVRYDAEGNPQHGNLVTYCIPTAAELPSFERIQMETPTPINPLGAKGIGESGTIGATPAVHNAVVDALSHLGVRPCRCPPTARSCGERSRARRLPTPRYARDGGAALEVVEKVRDAVDGGVGAALGCHRGEVDLAADAAAHQDGLGAAHLAQGDVHPEVIADHRDVLCRDTQAVLQRRDGRAGRLAEQARPDAGDLGDRRGDHRAAAEDDPVGAGVAADVAGGEQRRAAGVDGARGALDLVQRDLVRGGRRTRRRRPRRRSRRRRCPACNPEPIRWRRRARGGAGGAAAARRWRCRPA